MKFLKKMKNNKIKILYSKKEFLNVKNVKDNFKKLNI